ncbi:50S ribosomal protein L7/L12 [Candidatus Poribacteria bacterium]|nr:50S ribosomal protein L7/L12 [Candidatus Poribacteria bacterium]MEE2911812.1 50S ribosomal protein L7/L12 [Candidatus Poribacteria bacterium]|tara:strand:+ start:536 stop:931 length:396 start_codon:yes stop_codon:yes gene_type:complete
MADVQELVDQISEMTVLELSELVKAIEDKFGVSAAAPVMAAGMMPMGAAGAEGEGEAAAEEQTEFDVELTEIGDQKIKVIKEVRAITGLGLREAKEAVEGAPNVIKEAASKEEAEEIKEKLEAVGASATIK